MRRAPRAASSGKAANPIGESSNRGGGPRSGAAELGAARMDEPAIPNRAYRLPLRPPGEAGNGVARREDRIGIARHYGLDTDLSGRSRKVGVDVATPGALDDLAQVAAPTDRDRGLLPHENEDPRRVRRRADAGRSELGVEGACEGIGGGAGAEETAEEAGDPRYVGEQVAAHLHYRHPQRPEPIRGRRVLRRVIEEYEIDRKSTRLNSSHLVISYAGFCL